MSAQPDLSNALVAAPALLGWLFVRDSNDGLTSGYIVETEAYLATDAASHSFRGKTPRNEIMFGPPSYLYVYFTYGMHHCVNIVTGKAGQGEAVLIRAIQPVNGIELMRTRRGDKPESQLTNGPAKFAQAMGINRTNNGEYIDIGEQFQLLPGIIPAAVTQTTRVGISQNKEKPYRFYISGNPYVSKP